MGLKVEIFPEGPLGENTYLVTDEATGYKAIIDPGYYGQDVIEKIGDKDSLKYLLITHCHFDHFYATDNYLDVFEHAEFVAPEKEKYLMSKDWSRDYMTRGRGLDVGMCPAANIYVKEGDHITLGESEFSFIETPGHTEGGMCIQCGNILFSGDTLFRLSVGNTSFETGSWDELMKSIKEKLYALDDEIIVYPGHGAATTIGYEKRANPFV